MYSLYFNKSENKIILKKMGKIILGKPTEEGVNLNQCYYISTDRKALKQKGLEMKEQWIKEMEEDLEAVKNIKI